MAGGWTSDGAVQEQVDASLDDALQLARQNLPHGESEYFCVECDEPIPEKRRLALKGVKFCIACQAEHEKTNKIQSTYNRRGSKDSQLK
ncbi:DksA/TraR family C4-type zinc finger protein [Bartonella sp. HY329]|uniref:DksA/TraR family C4-type zinc finger protein n=1 Tax=unclassified Bartonella TaxID=2645622 RepID=UPI0021C66944|nr:MULTISPECIES: DksA/TraR family C4-type zinc finger protein [unclassified Bartonella]UXM95848.1 DksA/TraR family C4-type zinc finger protein [Bartonella sp. HY329]UXN10173.1 DksA/TraR family C4-type zinc finger protein [Bartonella sp. HY328]